MAEHSADQSPRPDSSLFAKAKRSWKWLAPGALIVVVALGFLWWWFFMRGKVVTDDAYVKADEASVGSRIQGTVEKVYVDNNQAVEQGDLLVRLDPRDYRAAADAAAAVVSRLRADTRGAEADLEALKQETDAQIRKAQAKIEQLKFDQQAAAQTLKVAQEKLPGARTDLKNAQKEYERYKSLFGKGDTSAQRMDEAQTAADQAASTLHALEAQIESLKASLKAADQNVAQAEADLLIARSNEAKIEAQRYQVESLQSQTKEASAQLEQAKLNLSYTVIKAPIKGVVAQKNIQVGDRVQPGQPFMAVVPLQNAYAEANYKETKLEHVRIGQRATIEADAYPGRVFHGTVAGVHAGTGAAFALLPPQNASGNWIKVVQRVPVRIDFQRPLPKEHPLRVGLSLKATIYTREASGTKTEANPP